MPVRLTWRVLDGDRVAEEGAMEIEIASTPGAAASTALPDRSPAVLTIETDVATAAEMRAGGLSAQHALLLGRLTVQGDVALLPSLAAAIGDVDA